MKPPPLYLDLYYLLTPFAQTKLTEHILLSKILAACNDNPVLSGKMLWGSLNETGNKELRLVLKTLTFEEIHHLWSLFPNTGYRPSLSYIVTPIQISSSRTLEIVRVLEKKVSYGIASRFDTE